MMAKTLRNIVFTGLFVLLICSTVASATVSFEDELDDVFFYPTTSYDRDDPHDEADVPEIDIESISCEVSTVGTTVVLNISGDFPTEFGEDYYSYYIWIYTGGEQNSSSNFFLRVDVEDQEWESYYNMNVHTYTINEGTLSIFFEGMFLNESTVSFQIDAIHTDADEGADRDWYPDGLEKQSGIEGGSDDGSADSSGNGSESDSSNGTPGFELIGVLGAVAVVVLVLRRR